MNIKKINLIVAVMFFCGLSACGQSRSKDKVMAGSSEDVKTYPEESQIPTGKKYYRPKHTILW